MDSVSMSVLIKLVQIFVIVPMSVAFVIFNRLSRTSHWGWDLFWGTYALNRIVFFFFWYEETFLWFFLNIILLTIEAFSLNELSKFYTGKSTRISFFSSLVMFPVGILGIFTPESFILNRALGVFYGRYLSLIFLGMVMMNFGIGLIRKYSGTVRTGTAIGWVIFISGISTAFSMISKLVTIFSAAQTVFNVFLVVSLFVTYLLFRIEIEIRKRNMLELLYDSVSKSISNVAMLRFTQKGEKIYSNPLASKLFPSITNLYEFEKIIKEPESLRIGIENALKTGKPSFLRVEISKREFISYIYPCKFNGENTVDIVILDSPELKEIENELKSTIESLKKQIDQQLGFFTNMVHELKSPLTIIKGYAEMLESSATVDQEKMLLSIHQAVDYQLSLINNLIEMSKIQVSKPKLKIEKVDLSEIITDVSFQFMDISSRKGIKFEIEENKLPREFYTDASKLKRILINLLDNAFKFTTSGKIKLSARSHNGNVYFEVKDTGIGIRREFLDSIFDRYTIEKGAINRELNPSGTGIGLYLTKELVELLGGKIKLLSEYGKGTTVFFTVSNMKKEG